MLGNMNHHEKIKLQSTMLLTRNGRHTNCRKCAIQNQNE